MAVCLGNHDFWMLDDPRKEVASLSEIIDRYWAPAAKSVDVVLLDQEICICKISRSSEATAITISVLRSRG